MLAVWTLKGLPAERTLTIKSAKLSKVKSQINELMKCTFNYWGPHAFIEPLIMFFPSYGLGPSLLRWANVQALNGPRSGPSLILVI